MSDTNNILSQKLQQLQPKVEERVKPLFVKATAPFPPEKISLIIYKLEQMVELWALKDKVWKKITEYPMTAYSGMLGPKLQEDDGQIPEGVYQMEKLNPLSKFYLSIRINYPNAFDLERAKEDGRTHSGSDIYIHGKDQTVGCVPVGDIAIEEIFYLAGAFGKGEVIISPCKFHDAIPEVHIKIKMHWYQRLMQSIRSAILKYDKEV
jgi:murein L,D-transpeptidase YafK